MKQVSHRFSRHRFTALMGPNGCGKSTLLRAVMGLTPSSGGHITLDGTPVGRFSRKALAQRIAYLPQESHCPDYMTLGELIELASFARDGFLGGPTAADRAVFVNALDTVGLRDLAHRPLAQLSGGQRQRAWIALVLAQDADLILMDEPVNHLDVTYQYALMALIAELTHARGKTIVSVLHDVNLTATFADDLVLMRDGQITAAGPVRDVLTPHNLRQSLEIEADIFERGDRLVCLPQTPAHT